MIPYEKKSHPSPLISAVAEKFPMIKVITYIIGLFDPYGIDHSERVAILSVEIGKRMNLTDDQLEELELAALLHDIGKLGIPESIRAKPGALTEAEYSLMQQHTIISKKILERMNGGISPNVHAGVLHHHERWDGSGYPYGLIGDTIPIYSQIIGIADSFDAITHTRGYRLAAQYDHAVKQMVFEQNNTVIFSPEPFRHFLEIKVEKHV